jgi:hypothetical protein
MDEEDELKKFKWLLFATLAFLISTYYSWREFKFFAWGETAEATVTNTFETQSGNRRRTPLMAVEYSFTDSSTGPRSERDDVAVDWQLEGSTVMVQYLPGVADSSRLLGHSNTLPVWVFFGCLGWLGYNGFKVYREASEAVHGKKRRR